MVTPFFLVFLYLVYDLFKRDVSKRPNVTYWSKVVLVGSTFGCVCFINMWMLPICASVLLGVCFLKSQEVPEDIIGDEHVREEFGVNRFTTPSIKKLFEQLDELGELPYAELKREIPKTIPRERTLVALGLGTLISDGFLVVQSEEIEELENIGRAVLKQAQVLGAGKRVTKYTKSILENSVLGKSGQNFDCFISFDLPNRF